MKNIFKILVGLSLLGLTGCTDPESTKKTLENNGYKDVTIDGYDPFACSKDDMFHTGFTAVNIASNKQVSGVVCGNAFKGSTIRLK